MANMNQVEMVDTKVTDGGLAQVFQIAQLHQLMVEKFAKEEVTNLSDFVSYWTKADYEKEAVEFRDEIEDLKKEKKRVDVARLRTAIVLARAVLEKPAAPSESQIQAVDMEAPLTAKEKESIAAAWTSRYNMVLSMWLDPADSLVSRLYVQGVPPEYSPGHSCDQDQVGVHRQQSSPRAQGAVGRRADGHRGGEGQG